MPSSGRFGSALGAVPIVAALLAAAPAAAQSGAPVAPAAAIDRYLEAERVRQHIPGLSVAVLHRGRVLLSRGYGFANLEHRVRATDSTVYQSGSVGKQFTAALVQLLAREGRLGLDDPIRRYVPGPPAWDSITIRHLLTHTSGIPDYADSALDHRRDYTEDDLVRLAGMLGVEFPPGEHHHYSNTGYLLLGAIVRRVTGRFYGDELRARIFGPLGMATTRIITERDIVPNRSDGYQLDAGEPVHQDWVAPSINTTADGSLYFTVNDLVRWARALDRGPIPGRELLDSAWTPARVTGGGTYPYGFGWEIGEQRGHRRIGHGGSWQGFRTTIQRYPEQGLTVIVLANLAEAEPEAIAYAVAGLIEPALAAPHVQPASAAGTSAPPRPIPELLRAVADRRPGAAAARLDGFLLPSTRRAIGELLEPAARWTFAGCDAVAGKNIERLGQRVARVCYARATGGEAGHLVEVSYTGAGEAAFIDWYDF